MCVFACMWMNDWNYVLASGYYPFHELILLTETLKTRSWPLTHIWSQCLDLHSSSVQMRCLYKCFMVSELPYVSVSLFVVMGWKSWLYGRIALCSMFYWLYTVTCSCWLHFATSKYVSAASLSVWSFFFFFALLISCIPS